MFVVFLTVLFVSQKTSALKVFFHNSFKVSGLKKFQQSSSKSNQNVHKTIAKRSLTLQLTVDHNFESIHTNE